MKDYVRLTDRTNLQMLGDAKQKMVDGRSDLLNNAGRTIERKWEYYDGKKTAAKVATGLVIGGGVAAAGVATHGAAIPVAAVVGIAAGGYIAGKVADTAVGRMWDMGYTGGSRTRAWVKDNGGHKDRLEVLEARVHKTIRHAVQHIRTAREKLNKTRRLPQFGPSTRTGPGFPPATTCCTDAFQAITALLHVKHHLEKARLYLHPATFLLDRLLDLHEMLYKRWNGQDVTQLQKPWHPPNQCSSKKCYFEKDKDTSSTLHRGNWLDLGDYRHSERKDKLTRVFSELSRDIGVHSSHFFNKLSPQMRQLIQDAESSYEENRDSCFVHTAHGVTNWWDRKTHSEQGAFIAKNAISGMIAVGAGGAHIKLDDALNAFAALMDAGFTALDLGVGESFEGVGLSSGKLRKDGKQGQEGLRHAAVHLWEAQQVDRYLDEEHPGYQLRALSSKACERTIDYLKNVYKIQHHLSAVRGDLREMIDLADNLTKFTKRGLDEVAIIAVEYGKSLEWFWKTHPRCQGRCYNTLVI